MTRFATLCMCLSLTVLPGCLPGDPTLPSVPAGYSSVPVGATPSGRTRYAVVPDACLQEPDTERLGVDNALPPLGCANGYNLQKMAERKSDLVNGRRIGSAPAGPSARAAANYLNGTKEQTTNPDPNGAPDNSGAAPGKKTAPDQTQPKVTAGVKTAQ